MKIRTCPQCHQKMLISTGAFWTCYACSFAITSQALSVAITRDTVQAGCREGRQRR
jgi:hypothetical protein